MTNSISKKSKRAVLVSIEEENDDYRLRLDDVIQEIGSTHWLQNAHFTSKLYPKDTLANLSLEEKEITDFGYTILSRLYAFIKRNEF